MLVTLEGCSEEETPLQFGNSSSKAVLVTPHVFVVRSWLVIEIERGYSNPKNKKQKTVKQKWTIENSFVTNNVDFK